MSRDPFDMDAGGNKADYIATIESVSFAPGRFGDFQATINNKYETPRPKDDGTLSTGRPEFIKIGSNDLWVAIDNGTGFIAASGDVDKRVRADSRFGVILGKVIEFVGADALREQGRTNPYTEAFWLGLKFHWETQGDGVPYDFENEEGGRQKGVSKGFAVPTEYLGASGTASTNGHAPTLDLSTLNIPDNVLDLLREIAADSPSEGDFQAKALPVALGADDPVVKAAVSAALGHKGFYSSLQAFG